MTREEFFAKYRPRLLVFLTEAWACRREPPSSLGLVIDKHHLDLRHILTEMWNDFNRQQEDSPPNNNTSTPSTQTTQQGKQAMPRPRA